LQRFADLSRGAAVALTVTSLFAASVWGAYQLADDEWETASYGGRDYSCGSSTSDPEPATARPLPGDMNGKPVYAISRPFADGPPTVLQVRVGDRYRECALIGGP
jgi:hypothetical protein